ncbi:hypothetical protein [[Clostridium] symbiosum]|uniref:hypothetical protein n=1 Tax=Clostridium symbiosum TaxID=1512 RepID=UPI001923EA33|nr:hypothetical protein [[Clostridium] symbiosum]
MLPSKGNVGKRRVLVRHDYEHPSSIQCFVSGCSGKFSSSMASPAAQTSKASAASMASSATQTSSAAQTSKASAAAQASKATATDF